MRLRLKNVICKMSAILFRPIAVLTLSLISNVNPNQQALNHPHQKSNADNRWNAWNLAFSHRRNEWVMGFGRFQIKSRYSYDSDVTWTSWCLKSPTTRLFVQCLVQLAWKKNKKKTHQSPYWPLVREISRVSSHYKGLWYGKCFRVMTSFHGCNDTDLSLVKNHLASSAPSHYRN